MTNDKTSSTEQLKEVCQESELNKMVRESRKYRYFTTGKPERKTHCKKCHGINGLNGVCLNCGVN